MSTPSTLTGSDDDTPARPHKVHSSARGRARGGATTICARGGVTVRGGSTAAHTEAPHRSSVRGESSAGGRHLPVLEAASAADAPTAAAAAPPIPHPSAAHRHPSAAGRRTVGRIPSSAEHCSDRMWPALRGGLTVMLACVTTNVQKEKASTRVHDGQ